MQKRGLHGASTSLPWPRPCKELNISLIRRDLQRGPMYTLFHHPFCPHSRFIRLVLGEYGLDLRLVEERVWERREGFLALNPACATPVLFTEGQPAIPSAPIIAEFIDETRGPEMGERRLLPTTMSERIEVRRLYGG